MKKIIFLMLFVLSYAANSQSLQIFDIDTTDFPTMRAKFYAVDKDGKLARPSISELKLKEDGIERQITNVSCPPKKQRKISVCIMVDTYKYIDLARAGTERLINFLDMPNEDEIAITYMSGAALIHQDFTKEKVKALEKASNIPAAPGVNINAMFNSPYTGGIPFIKDRSTDKKVLILVSDLHCPNLNIDEQKLITEANANNISIYSVLLSTSDYSGVFKRIASASDAIVFENVRTETQIHNIFEEIAFIENNEPCTIEWDSDFVCNSTQINVELSLKANISNNSYKPNSNAIASLKVEPNFIFYGKRLPSSINDTTITIKAQNADFTINSINLKYGSSDFSIVNTNFPLFIPKNTSKSIILRFSPSDSSLQFDIFEFHSDKCLINISISGGYAGKKIKKQALKLTYPNGGESFIAGSDTLISWEGISPSDTVRLDFSIDSGRTWKLITKNAFGLRYHWNNLPLPISKDCIVRISQNNYKNSINTSINPKKILTLKGHLNYVYTVDYRSDGNRIVTGGRDNTVKVWDANTGEIINTLIGHSNEVLSVSYSPNGKRIVTGSTDQTSKIWDADSGTLLNTLTAYLGIVNSVSFSPDGSRIVMGNLVIWDANTGTLIQKLIGHISQPLSVSYSPDGSRIVTGNTDKTAKIWDANTGKLIQTLNGHNGEVQSVAYSPEGSRIVTGSTDKTAKIWDANTGKLIQTLNGHNGEVQSVAYSPEGSRIVTGSTDHTAIIWDANLGTILNRLSEHTNIVSSVDFNPEGSRIVTGSRDNTAIIWEVSDAILQEDESDSVFSIIAPEPKFKNINIDMGKVLVGASKDASIDTVLCNIGDAPLHVLGVDVTNGDISEFQVPRGAGDFYLPANECRDMMFAFMPNKVGKRSAKITVKSTIGDYVDTINITGEGIQPTLQIINPYIDFGALELGMAKDTLKALTVKNISTQPITIDNSKHNKPNDVDFTTLAGAGSFTLAPNESKEMDLRFRPSEGGRTNGTLEFHYNNIGSPAIIQLFGEGIGGILKISNDSAFASEMRQFKLQLAKMKPTALSAVADNFEVKIKFQGTIITPNSASLITQMSNDSTYMMLKGAIGSSNDLATFNLIAGLGSVDETAIDIEEIKLFDAQGNPVFYDLERESGHFKLLGVCYEGGARLINPSGQAAQILSISPNPAENWLDLEVSLIEKGATEIAIFNINGEKVKTLLNEEIESTGTFNLSSDLQDISSGQYYIILKTPTYIETNQLMIVK